MEKLWHQMEKYKLKKLIGVNYTLTAELPGRDQNEGSAS